MDLVAFIDSSQEDQDLAIDLAITLADYCVEEGHRLWLACDAVCAVEIGLGLLGKIDAPTVEGGERRISPIHLLPLLLRPETPEAGRLTATEVAEDENGGDLGELIDLGIFARADDTGGERLTDGLDRRFGSDPATALRTLIAKEAPRFVIGLGTKSELWQSVSLGLQESYGRVSVVSIDGFGRTDFEGPIVRRSIEATITGRGERPEETEDELRITEIEAKKSGELVANFLQFLATL